MNGIAEVREEYKQAARQFIRHINIKERNPSNIEYEGRMAGLEIALRCLGVDSDELREIYKTCKEEVEHDRIHQAATDAANQIEREEEQEQEELDAIERPAAQAQVESDEVTLEHIRARFASPATSADIRNAVQAFEEGFKELDR